MIQILYGVGDHQNKGEALARSYPGAHCGPADKTPLTKPGLDTLTFWGHGDSSKLCHLTPPAFVKLVSDWKKLNPTLKTVEIITCNARHATGGSDSYTKQVVSGIRKKHSDMAVKALPMGMGSTGAHAWSILKFSPPTGTWCYVTAPGTVDTDFMWPAVHMVEAEMRGLGGYDLAAGARIVEAREKMRKFTLNYGQLNALRAQLVVLR